jgi:2'-5' RNA ligase
MKRSFFNQNKQSQASQEPSECWAEFSIDQASSTEITGLCGRLAYEVESKSGVKIKPATGHHVTLLYGYKKSESDKLLEIVEENFDEPFTLTAGKIRFGDVSSVILLQIEIPQELNDLFLKLYNTIGAKKHTLIDGKYYAHITVASFIKEDKDQINLEQFKDSLKGKKLIIDSILSFSEDKDGNNILLGDISHSSEQVKLGQ